MGWADPGDAMRAWRKVGVRIPVRPDGHPNRPLTAYTVEVLRIPNRVGPVLDVRDPWDAGTDDDAWAGR